MTTRSRKRTVKQEQPTGCEMIIRCFPDGKFETDFKAASDTNPEHVGKLLAFLTNDNLNEILVNTILQHAEETDQQSLCVAILDHWRLFAAELKNEPVVRPSRLFSQYFGKGNE